MNPSSEYYFIANWWHLVFDAGQTDKPAALADGRPRAHLHLVRQLRVKAEEDGSPQAKF